MEGGFDEGYLVDDDALSQHIGWVLRRRGQALEKSWVNVHS